MAIMQKLDDLDPEDATESALLDIKVSDLT